MSLIQFKATSLRSGYIFTESFKVILLNLRARLSTEILKLTLIKIIVPKTTTKKWMNSELNKGFTWLSTFVGTDCGKASESLGLFNEYPDVGAAASVGGSTRADVPSLQRGPWWSCVAAGRPASCCSHSDAGEAKIDKDAFSKVSATKPQSYSCHLILYVKRHLSTFWVILICNQSNQVLT